MEYKKNLYTTWKNRTLLNLNGAQFLEVLPEFLEIFSQSIIR